MLQGCELDRFLIEFKRHLQVLAQRFLFFEFGKNDRVQVRVHSPVQNIPSTNMPQPGADPENFGGGMQFSFSLNVGHIA